ncbi:MAG: heme biosynthesis HemY N-terminal domain-containing protein [Burkholderiaceae bacterium]
MKLLISWTVALVLAVALGLLLRYRDGMVSIVLPPHRFDVGANTAALLLIGGFIALYLIVRVGLQAIRAPGAFKNWRASRQKVQANESLRQALLALNEGRSDEVARLATAAMKHPETAGAATLLAARAADRQGDVTERDRWLHLLQAYPSLRDARLMFMAEVAVDRTNAAAALEALDALPAKAAGSDYGLRLRLRALEQAGQWERVLEVVARLVKKKALGEQAAMATRVNAYESLFEESVTVPGRVEQLFKGLSRADRENVDIIVAAAEAFAQSGQEQQAFKLIDKRTLESVEPRLLILFTRLNSIKHSDRLRCAENWLVRHPDNPLVLATLGRLCLAEGLWGKAEAFLKKADELEPSPFTRLALAEMYDAIGRGAEATQLYRTLANEKPGVLSLPSAGDVPAEAGQTDTTLPPSVNRLD